MSRKSSALLYHQRLEFHRALLGSVLSSDDGIPSNADGGSKYSVAIASHILGQLGKHLQAPKLVGQKSGKQFEQHVHQFLQSTFPKLDHLRPGIWEVVRVGSGEESPGSLKVGSLSDFEQYMHLASLGQLVAANPKIAADLGSDYLIKPDTVIARLPEDDASIDGSGEVLAKGVAERATLRKTYNKRPILHASISCKWTLRSDRAQNARSEALNLIRNRKGRLPHITVVTGEPSPSRLASLALGTGDIDCVYHFALPELILAVQEASTEESKEQLAIMVEGRRLKDIADLPLDLAV